MVELQYTIERAVIMCEKEILEGDDLLFSPIETYNGASEEAADFKLSTIEKNTILKVIEKHNGNISKAAKELGLTRNSTLQKIKQIRYLITNTKGIIPILHV